MVAWVVMNRQQPRQTPPSFFPAPIPILGLTPPSSQAKLPLCFHTLAWNPFYNPFVFNFMHVMGGGAPPPRDPDCLSPTPCPLLVPSKAEGSPFFSHSCAIFCTRANLNSFLFKRFRTLCEKPPGVGGHLPFLRSLASREPTRGSKSPALRKSFFENKKGGHTGRPSKISRELLRASALLLFFGRLLCRWGSRRLRRRRWSLRRSGHAVLEAADTLAKSLHDFRDALAAKENQYNGQNHEPVKNAEFTHVPPPRAPLGGALSKP